MRAFSLLAVVALVGCGQVSPATNDAPADEGEPGVSVTTQPVVDPDYGIYRDTIFQGGEMLAGSVEFAEYLVGCMAGLGYAATVVGPGAVRHDVSPDQSAASLQAYDECMQGAIDDGLIAGEFPDEETARLYYRAYVEVAYECLNEQGYPTTPPPSEDVWVQDFPLIRHEPWRVWMPHRLVDPYTVESLEGACSQSVVDLLIELGRRDSEAAP